MKKHTPCKCASLCLLLFFHEIGHVCPDNTVEKKFDMKAMVHQTDLLRDSKGHKGNTLMGNCWPQNGQKCLMLDCLCFRNLCWMAAETVGDCSLHSSHRIFSAWGWAIPFMHAHKSIWYHAETKYDELSVEISENWLCLDEVAFPANGCNH